MVRPRNQLCGSSRISMRHGPQLKCSLAEQGITFEWVWNVPKASHMNGVVESLIKSIRRALENTCKMAAYTEEQWRTFLSEVTYLLNSRPLYPASSNIWEEPPIIPNDVIMGPSYRVAQAEPEELVNPRHLSRSIQKRVFQFWQCWLKYFAPSLLVRTKWNKKRGNLELETLYWRLTPNAREPNGRWYSWMKYFQAAMVLFGR